MDNSVFNELLVLLEQLNALLEKINKIEYIAIKFAKKITACIINGKARRLFNNNN